MNVLILYDTSIKAWLVNEPLENAEAHIQNGYPDLLEGYQAGTVKAEVIDISDEDSFKADLYEIVDGQVTRKI